MICEGETVCDAKLHIGFNFRGIEHLAETRNYIQVIALMERVCGICSNIHTLTLCQAMEELTGQTPPPRAQYIRVVVAELERLHSHVLWAGIASKLMGFKTMFMTCFEIREKIMDVLAAISGNRVNYSMNRIGGVNRDIEDPLAILAMIEQLEREMMRTVIPIFTTSSTARSRCAGIGVLTHEKAISCGVVGPTARASGLPQDLAPRRTLCCLLRTGIRRARRDRPAMCAPACLSAPWRSWRAAAFFVRRSPRCRPAKSTPETTKFVFITGTATSRVEAPRGEVMYSVSWKRGLPKSSRVHVRTPTFANMPAVRWMVQGARLADTPLIQASIDPCYSCTDR